MRVSVYELESAYEVFFDLVQAFFRDEEVEFISRETPKIISLRPHFLVRRLMSFRYFYIWSLKVIVFSLQTCTL